MRNKGMTGPFQWGIQEGGPGARAGMPPPPPKKILRQGPGRAPRAPRVLMTPSSPPYLKVWICHCF